MFKIKPITLFRKDGLYFNPVTGKGLGVFCEHDIVKGETIEVAPVFMFNEQDSAAVEKTIVADYYFSAQNMPEDYLRRLGIHDAKKASCMAMGVVSYCNHMVEPNAQAEKIFEHQAVYYRLSARHDIPAHTEICINYGLSWMTMRRMRDTGRVISKEDAGHE